MLTDWSSLLHYRKDLVLEIECIMQHYTNNVKKWQSYTLPTLFLQTVLLKSICVVIATLNPNCKLSLKWINWGLIRARQARPDSLSLSSHSFLATTSSLALGKMLFGAQLEK